MNPGESESVATPLKPNMGTRVLLTLSRKRMPNLFPPAAAQPLTLLWVWLLPQALLIFLNLRAWALAGAEMNPSQSNLAYALFGVEAALWLGGAAWFAACALRKRPVSRLAGGAFLLGASIYLSFFILKAQEAIPAAVQQWMLPTDQLLFDQFALIGPGMLYGAFRLLCPDRESDILSGGLAIILALASPFVLILLAIGAATSGSFLGIRGEWSAYIFVPVYIATSMFAAGAVLRLCISGYVAARRSGPVALALLTFIVAVILPVGGLLLNIKIPFPVDLQIPAIYALAVVNGLVLTLPNFSNPVLRRIVWLAQCAMFPFTVYFFAVFLPVLPLMPLGAICFALGLLICVPSALFLLHGCRILDSLKLEMRVGSRAVPLILAIAAVASGPALLTAKILRDRTALTAALDYLQYPDYAQPAGFQGDRDALRTALLNLREFKEGRYLPFYSEFYNWLAFDNLLLPDRKLAATWDAFFGDEMPKLATGSMRTPFLFGGSSRGPNNKEILSSTDGPRPPAEAVTGWLQTGVLSSPGEVRATARLTMSNPTLQASEYRALIHVPAGVWITGMRLKISDAMVPARLFEERAALWVYTKITNNVVRRDPAILRYVGPESAELRVFPVNARDTRYLEIDFAYPDNLSPSITLDGRALELPPAARNTAVVSGTTAWVPPAAVASIAPIQRIPQPQLLVDVSKSSTFRDNPTALGEALNKALDAFPAAKSARVMFVNFDIHDFRGGGAIPIDELRKLDPAVILSEAKEFEGGFLESFAIKSALIRHEQSDPSSVLHEFPAVVALRGAKHNADVNGAQLAEFARCIPDQPAWWSLDPNSAHVVMHPIDSAAPPTDAITSVHVFKIGKGRFAVAADRTGLLVSWNPESPDALAVYDPAKQSFVPVPAAANAGTNVAAGASVWALAFQRTFHPSESGDGSLAALVAAARKTGVLVPSTAYMVVENTAQWEMLNRTQQKTLKGHEALALSETGTTPEPSTIALILAACAALFIHHRFTRKTAVAA